MKQFLYCIASLLILVSCSTDKENDTRTVFRYNEPGGITSLDPAFSSNFENIWATNMLFNGLVELDANLNLKPALATHWELDSAKTTYTFHLKKGIFFHDNACFEKPKEVTAYDFKYSFERLVDKGTASPGRWVMNKVQRDTLGQLAIHVLDSFQLAIQLSEPFSPFLSQLAMTYCSVVPSEAVDMYGKDFSRNPVGTGPFKFFIWKEGIQLVLHRNPTYFETDELSYHLPYLDAVAISFLKDKNAAYLGVIKGDFDMLSGLDPSYRDEMLTPNGELNPQLSKEFNLQKLPFLKTDYLGIYLDPNKNNNPALLNPKVRLALSKAINREAYIANARSNIGTAANSGFVPTSLLGEESSEALSYSYQEAINLLSEAGYPKGEGISEVTISTTATATELCEYIQRQWQKLGLKVSVEVLPEAVHRKSTASGDLSVFRKSWVSDYPDAENFLNLFYSASLSPYGPNYTHYENARFDSLLVAALGSESQEEKLRLYREANQLVCADSPVIPIFFDEVVRLVNKRVTGLEPNKMNLLDLRRVKLK